MKPAVTDANIFIDLIELELLHLLFDLGIEIHTTKAVYDQLNAEQQIISEPFVQSKALIIYNFSFNELSELSQIAFPTGLEPADKSVYYYSIKIGAMILSGDKRLRTFCESKSVEVRGIIWVFDRFVSNSIISKRTAAAKLQLLMDINNRIPFEDCKKRISKWNSE